MYQMYHHAWWWSLKKTLLPPSIMEEIIKLACQKSIMIMIKNIYLCYYSCWLSSTQCPLPMPELASDNNKCKGNCFSDSTSLLRSVCDAWRVSLFFAFAFSSSHRARAVRPVYKKKRCANLHLNFNKSTHKAMTHRWDAATSILGCVMLVSKLT